ncbi:MAG: hypothetical protein JST54_14850 [Deltaproteobacteria bacterium]|nr:hypothetical protein [Deltaproteobacteria bacterium]
MNKLLLAAAFASLTGCAALADSMENGAVNAAGGVADHAVSNAGDRATDSAIDHAANAGSKSGSQASATASTGASSKLEADDVLVLDGSTYAVGKMMGGTGTALLIADGRKVDNAKVVGVRAASKTELTVGADVYYCADSDVRRGRWAKGSVTDASKLGDNRVDVGSSRGLDTGAQVAIAR